jgi:nitrite reductase/ring-hydroxylating ferredoxin subunit
MENWIDIGSADELSATPLKRVTAMNRDLAVSYKDAKFGVLSNTCNHAGGPLGKGRLDGEYIICPWHNWKFHRCSGKGEPGFEDDCVPAYQVKVENGRVLIDLNSATKRHKKPHGRIRLRVRLNARPDHCVSLAFPQLPRTPTIHGSPAPITYSIMRCEPHARSTLRRGALD